MLLAAISLLLISATEIAPNTSIVAGNAGYDNLKQQESAYQSTLLLALENNRGFVRDNKNSRACLLHHDKMPVFYSEHGNTDISYRKSCGFMIIRISQDKVTSCRRGMTKRWSAFYNALAWYRSAHIERYRQNKSPVIISLNRAV